MKGLAVRMLPYSLVFLGSMFIMVLELVASRLVARHVGGSLMVWTSVIGVMLGGICLGNFLGGRLADRVDPRKAIGSLYAMGSAFTLATLWINALAGMTPDVEAIPWLRTLVVVTIDFLIPGTMLGMISPVVAKIAVEESTKTGVAIGNVYTLGAVGSIVGTFFAGFYLMYVAPTSTVVTVVAAALALLAAGLLDGPSRFIALLAGLLLGIGSINPVGRMLPASGVSVDSVPINPVALVGHGFALALGIAGALRLLKARRESASEEVEFTESGPKPDLRDLSILSFIASLAFMAFEMDAGRIVTRHLGSSIYGWTSVIAILLGGLSLGNFLGGLIAGRIREEKQAGFLFSIASALVLSVLLFETPPKWLCKNPVGYLFSGEPAVPLFMGSSSALSSAIVMTGYPWWYRVVWVVFIVFFLPSVAMGTFSPVIAKLAVERFRRLKKTGAAIGQVYAWGMVGSILGTFLTSFFLIDWIGTKGVLVLLGVMLALTATTIGNVFHAAWAGIPLGLAVIAFMPMQSLQKRGEDWGIREEIGDPATTEDAKAWIDESNYYYIKVENSPDADGQKRTIVLDNLIHGYFILGHPERLDYDYEHIYAMVSHRVAKARAKEGNKPDLKNLGIKTLFLGGGAYTFPRYLQHTYPGTVAEVAEIDPSVNRANRMALGLPEDTTIKTTFGDARQYVERNVDRSKDFDIVFGDAFNDFSVPWHLTTKEFNDKLAKLLGPDGVYMINIIDVYESDKSAAEKAERLAKKDSKTGNPTAEELASAQRTEQAKALRYGGFLGSWVKTAKLTFPHIYVFGTHAKPGTGLRETFVVVAAKKPIDVEELGSRDDDPKFFNDDKLFEPRPYAQPDLDALEIRSRGITLTDDYAPVENLLAPVAETRGDDD